jgi:hypothetical protein
MSPSASLAVKKSIVSHLRVPFISVAPPLAPFRRLRIGATAYSLGL